MPLSPADQELLRQLLAEQERAVPRGVTALAEHLGLSAPTLVRRLKALEAGGWVERIQRATQAGREVIYRPRARVVVQWLSPDRGALVEWAQDGDLDASAPLVGQVPDADARAALVALIGRLRSGRRLPPHGRPAGWDGHEEPAITLVAFGSTARGTATASSDVDVVAFTPAADDEEEVLEAAADASIVSARPLQVTVFPIGRLSRIPKAIADALRDDGLVVFDGLGDAGVWRLVYGGRSGTRSGARGRGR